jgi:hypothetical protein
MGEPVYYSLRRMPPYQGTVQIIEVDGHRAISRDGALWQVHLRTSGVGRVSQVAWSEERGGLIETDYTRAILAALRNRPHGPFPFTDHLELWLLGAGDGLPLALLQTLVDGPPPMVHQADWNAGLGEYHAFVAPSLFSDPAPDQEMPMAHAEVLTRCVRAAAGPLPRAQWFRRTDDGSGVGLTGLNLDVGMAGRMLRADDFPELLLREEWDNDLHRRLVEEYHDWQAPNLLTNTGLRRSTRDALEHAACRQAQRLYAVRQLLPEIVNQDLVEAALVEGRMRQAAM